VDGRLRLPSGSILSGDYCIQSVLGAGAFGITYAAEDLRLGSTVAIKEYYPVDFGARDEALSVQPKSERLGQPFEWGLASFLKEARVLARLKHPSIVRVARVFEANDTAYMVMEFERGQNLEAWLDALGRPPSQEELDRIVGPLLDALDLMHRDSLLHRDISPDNIIVRPDGTPVLLDFGAARPAVAGMSGSVTRIVKAGYSPHEQYATNSRLQGPWSDIYALGGTLYRAVAGRPPTEATTRVEHDDLLPAVDAAKGLYRGEFLAGIDACLRVKQADRPQSVAQLRPLLAPPPTPRRAPWPAWSAAAAAAAIAIAAGYYGWMASQRGLATDSQERLLQSPDRPNTAALEAEPPAAEAERIREEPKPREAPSASPGAEPEPRPGVPDKPAGRAAMTIEQERALPAGAAFKDCESCPEMIVAPAGTFLMGSPQSEVGRLEFEGPVHQVAFAGKFAVSRHAVTRDEFEAFVAATGHRVGQSCHAQTVGGWADKPGHSFLSPPDFSQDGRHPAVCVSWNDANAYVRWLSEQTNKPFRLLTEAEREYIARAGTATPYWWGPEATPAQANFDTKPRPRPGITAAPHWEQKAGLGVATGGTRSVDAGLPNPWGFVHVHGNVAEWVQDCWNADYEGAPADGSAQLDGDCSQRTVRGGAWSSWPEDIRAAYREMAVQDERYYSVGFRVARDLGK
jgi:formylglycine-generating enzyme required for sulfatase activity